MAETQSRTAREANSREQQVRDTYAPPSLLPDPKPHPDWDFRWIATHVLGQSDPSNVSRKLREGWEPVKAEDHPELQLMGTQTGNVELGGLMLCKMPKKRVQSRNAYYVNQAQSQMESVDNNFMRQSDPRMPLFRERRSEVKFGQGSA